MVLSRLAIVVHFSRCGYRQLVGGPRLRMYGYSPSGTGGVDAGYPPQPGYQTRSRARGPHEAQEVRYVEGDLFGGTKRPSFRSSEPPPGQPPRTPYHDGTVSGIRNGSSAGGYTQQPGTRPSPFERRPFNQHGGFTGAVPSPVIAAGGGGAHTYGGGGGYGHETPVANGGADIRRDYTPSGAWDGTVTSSEVALVPVDAGGNQGGDDMEDDDDLPTRSLVDTDSGEGVGISGGGIRQRRVGDGRVAAAVGGYGSRVEPDAKRDTWVVVWGVPPGKSNEVLTCFLEFGHIEEQRGVPDSNWLYFKYATRLQAEKALAAGHGSRLSDTVMLGVQKVVEDEVWHALREGRIPPLATAQPVLARGGVSGSTRTPSTQRSSRGGRIVDDSDILGAPPRRPRGEASICGRIKQYFGFYSQ